LQAPGKEVAIVDFDIVNPYFRSREVASVMKDLGIGVISSSPGLEAADLPSISPAVLRALYTPPVTPRKSATPEAGGLTSLRGQPSKAGQMIGVKS
jgi:hypothetical protein